MSLVGQYPLCELSSVGQVLHPNGKKAITDLALVVQKVDNAIHWINRYPLRGLFLSTLIRWIVIYPMDSVIQPLNNRGQGFIFLFLVCSSRKYPYPHYEGNFMQVLTPPGNFHFLNTKIPPPLLWNFHMFYVHPQYPLEKNSFGGKLMIT